MTFPPCRQQQERGRNRSVSVLPSLKKSCCKSRWREDPSLEQPDIPVQGIFGDKRRFHQPKALPNPLARHEASGCQESGSWWGWVLAATGPRQPPRGLDETWAVTVSHVPWG